MLAILSLFGLWSRRDEDDSLTYTYDPELDHLIAQYGNPTPCFNVEVKPGLVVRIGQESGRIAGLEVIDCAAMFCKAPSAITYGFVSGLLTKYGPQAAAKLKRRVSLTPSPGRP